MKAQMRHTIYHGWRMKFCQITREMIHVQELNTRGKIRAIEAAPHSFR